MLICVLLVGAGFWLSFSEFVWEFVVWRLVGFVGGAVGALVVVGFRCLAVVCGFPSVELRAWCLGLWLDCLRWVTSMDFRVDAVTSLCLVLLTWVGWVRMVGSLCGLLFWFSGVWVCSGGFTL